MPLYLSEIAPTEIRGAISSLNQLMIVGGILVAFLVNAVLASSEAWRVMLGLAVVPVAGPARRDDLDARDAALPRPRRRGGRGARGPRGGPRGRRAEEELEDIREVEAEEQGGGLRALGAAWVRPALLVAIGLAVFQQLVGINTIIYYAPTTLTNVGYSDQSAIYANIVIGVLNVGMTVLAIRLVDRIGRKPLLLAGLAGMVTSLLVLGVSLSVMSEPKSPGDPAAIITLVCLATFIASFAATWGPVVWVMLPEILPLSVRGAALGVAVCLQWLANFAVSQSFPPMVDAWGAGPCSSATRRWA